MPILAIADDIDYRLATGDKVKLVVFGQEDLSGEFEINGSGFITLPLIKQVAAAGLTVGELEITVTEKLRPDFLKNPKVTAEVLNYRPIYIIGEVKQPGSYPFASGMTVMKAVALAGGYSYRAREGKALITRSENKEEEPTPAIHSTAVRPGDVIEIPQRYF